MVLKSFVDCFSLYQESIWRFWFSIIKSSLRFTNSKSKWTRDAVIAVWLPLAKCLNLAGYDALLSPGLRIHDRRSRGRRSDLLKVPQNAKLTEYACWWRQTYNHLRQNNRYLPNMSNALGSAHGKPLNQSRSIGHFHIAKNLLCPPPPPVKFCTLTVSSFSWILKTILRQFLRCFVVLWKPFLVCFCVGNIECLFSQSFVFRHLVIAAVGPQHQESTNFGGGGWGERGLWCIVHYKWLMVEISALTRARGGGGSQTMNICFACCSGEQRKMAGGAKNKQTKTITTKQDSWSSPALQLSPYCALPFSLSSPAEHLGEGGDKG